MEGGGREGPGWEGEGEEKRGTRSGMGGMGNEDSRMDRNRQPQEVGGGDQLECTRNLGGERVSGLKGRNLR